MRVALDRVMDAYRMMVNLTPEEEQAARRAVERHLSQKPGNETSLAVEGLRYLRARWSPSKKLSERRHYCRGIRLLNRSDGDRRLRQRPDL